MAGERKEFPFRFKTPNGPVTYHGRYLYVDWYLTAQAISSPGSIFKDEQDFLLLGGNSTGEIILGDLEIAAKDLPARSPAKPASSQGLLEVKAGSPKISSFRSTKESKLFFLFWWFLILSFILGVKFLNLSLEGSFFVALGISIAAITILYTLQKVFNYVSKRKFEVGELRVEPARIYAGSQVNCHVDFQMKGEAYLHNIAASIYAQERVTSIATNVTTTIDRIAYEKTFVKPFDEQLSAGRWISFDCVLPVATDAPATFISKNNVLEWFVKVQVDFKGWPDWVEKLPITILP